MTLSMKSIWYSHFFPFCFRFPSVLIVSRILKRKDASNSEQRGVCWTQPLPVFCLMSYYNTLNSNPPWLVTSGRHFAISIFFSLSLRFGVVHSEKRSKLIFNYQTMAMMTPDTKQQTTTMTMRFMQNKQNTHFSMRLINALIKEIPLGIETANATLSAEYHQRSEHNSVFGFCFRRQLTFVRGINIELHWKWNRWTLDLSIVLISGAHSRSLCHMFPIFMHFRQTLCTIIRFWRNQIQNSQIKKETKQKSQQQQPTHTISVSITPLAVFAFNFNA